MANVEHSTLTTTNLHENKGVSTATDNTVATAVSGTTVWAKLTASSLTGTGNPFGAQLLHVSDEKTTGVTGGTFTSGVARTRTLNTIRNNEIGATVSSNQITLPAGTYYIEASSPAYSVDGHQAFLYNVTDAVYVLNGTCERVLNGSGTQSRSFVIGRFAIAGTKTFELRHQCTTTITSTGFGIPCGFSTEVYAEVKIWKVA